jgi:hypothetical protein
MFFNQTDIVFHPVYSYLYSMKYFIIFQLFSSDSFNLMI